MTKKTFIALADLIRAFNDSANANRRTPFTDQQLSFLADFCAAQNPAFNRERWLAYVAGECGPNGGKLKR